MPIAWTTATEVCDKHRLNAFQRAAFELGVPRKKQGALGCRIQVLTEALSHNTFVDALKQKNHHWIQNISIFRNK